MTLLARNCPGDMNFGGFNNVKDGTSAARGFSWAVNSAPPHPVISTERSEWRNLLGETPCTEANRIALAATSGVADRSLAFE